MLNFTKNNKFVSIDRDEYVVSRLIDRKLYTVARSYEPSAKFRDIIAKIEKLVAIDDELWQQIADEREN